jgi:uroporphyrin-III C-methyltransferase / precorrin-2 dehydrogenase / sirohydrochlorin ferrochelatase
MGIVRHLNWPQYYMMNSHDRIAPLAALPVFWKLKDRRVVLVGSSEGAVWKAELLSAAGAKVDVFEEGEPFSHIQNITLHPRRWQESDLLNASLAIADVETEAEAEAFVTAAKMAGVPVNIVDKPSYCEFQFGGIVNRSPLIVSISTDGAAPVFGQAIRTRIEAMLPLGLQKWAQAAKDWREDVQKFELPFRARRRFWEAFTAIAMAEPERTPSLDNRAALQVLAQNLVEETFIQGRVSLVGAGPGDADLLTLKAVRVLQSADVILYDNLVSREVLDMARREAERVFVGKTGHGPSCRQKDINQMMVGMAQKGQHVVRLKSGDPLIFGRAGEEIEACKKAGIPLDIVPGITTAQGAAANLHISLTHRDHARRMQFVTGHSKEGDLPADLDWNALADEAVTTVVYMPKHTIQKLVEQALKAGLDPLMPALAIENATRPQQQVVRATVTDLPQKMSAKAFAGPVLVMIGRVFEDRSIP